jgi:quercetin dioxygenase-like cupin family protein
MISKVERGESSPTAVVLGKLSAALELSVSELLAPATTGNRPGSQAGAGAPAGPDGGPASRGGGRVRRAADTPEWRDPDTGYLRRQVSTPRFPAAVTEVTLPPGARVPYPAGAYAFIAQLVWVLSGQLNLTDGPDGHVLAAGDTFELGEPRPREFRNDTAEDCRYAVIVTRTASPLPVAPKPRRRVARTPARRVPACRIHRRNRAKVKLFRRGRGNPAWHAPGPGAATGPRGQLARCGLIGTCWRRQRRSIACSSCLTAARPRRART